jgi:hypothetical protein
MNATTVEAANTTATSPSPSKKRSLSNASTMLRKRTKKKYTVDRDGTQESTKEKMITDLITSTSSSKDDVSGENAVPTKNKLVWDSKW